MVYYRGRMKNSFRRILCIFVRVRVGGQGKLERDWSWSEGASDKLIDRLIGKWNEGGGGKKKEDSICTTSRIRRGARQTELVCQSQGRRICLLL